MPGLAPPALGATSWATVGLDVQHTSSLSRRLLQCGSGYLPGA
jgi:hypothetical protein